MGRIKKWWQTRSTPSDSLTYLMTACDFSAQELLSFSHLFSEISVGPPPITGTWICPSLAPVVNLGKMRDQQTSAFTFNPSSPHWHPSSEPHARCFPQKSRVKGRSPPAASKTCRLCHLASSSPVHFPRRFALKKGSLKALSLSLCIFEFVSFILKRQKACSSEETAVIIQRTRLYTRQGSHKQPRSAVASDLQGPPSAPSPAGRGSRPYDVCRSRAGNENLQSGP